MSERPGDWSVEEAEAAQERDARRAMTDLDAISDYFWDRVDTSGEHWMWTGTRDSDGYGQLRLRSWRHRAHRTMWIILEGSVPDGLFVLHRCDVRACVRPTHLFLGSQADNMHDMAAKGRSRNQHTKEAVA